MKLEYVSCRSILAIITDHSFGVKAIRTAGSTAAGGLPPLLIELEAQIL